MAAALPSRAQLESIGSVRSRSDLLMRAIQMRDLATIQVLLNDDVDVDASTTYGTTPLMSAAAYGYHEIVRTLLERGAAIDTERADGFTALAMAVFFGHDEVVRELLAYGADLKRCGRSGTSPEMWALARGFFRLSDTLRFEAEQRANSSTQIKLVSKPAVDDRAINYSSVARNEQDPVEATLFTPQAEPIVNTRDHPDMSASNTHSEIPTVELDEAAAESKTLREVDAVVPFSPFVAVSDRLRTGRLPKAAALAFVILLAVVTFTVFKAFKRGRLLANSKVTVATTTATKPEESPALAAQPVPLATEQTEAPANVSTEKTNNEISSQSSNHTSSSSTNGLAVEAALPKRSEAKQRVAKTIFSYGNEAPRAGRKSRQGEVLLTGNKGSSADATGPAPPTTEPKPPTVQPRRSSPTSDVPPLPAEPIKGSSTKIKVIQWP